MCDMMIFPDTVEEFMEQYKMIDRDQVYSNGVEYVPIFRMEQWFRHKKGEWVAKDGIPINHKLKMMEEAFCSQCGNSAPGYPFWECDLDLTNFCPNCGADMRGEENV